MYVCMYVWMDASRNACNCYTLHIDFLNVYIHVYIYIHMYIYIYMYILRSKASLGGKSDLMVCSLGKPQAPSSIFRLGFRGLGFRV